MLTVSTIEHVIGSKLAQLAHLTFLRSEQVTFGAACRRFPVLWLAIRQAPVPDSMRAGGLPLLDRNRLSGSAKCDVGDASFFGRLLHLNRDLGTAGEIFAQEPFDISTR